MGRVEKPPVDRPDEEEMYRLLIVDGFTSHTTVAFAEYCIKFDIIIAVLPPHSTHLMQPLNVGVFLPLKAAHQKAQNPRRWQPIIFAGRLRCCISASL
ncbi:DDE superfamily endonuclease, CENP-B-like protein [Metarhizium brunneum]